MRFKDYKRPATLEEAYELNQKKSNRIVAGNMWLRLQKNCVGTAIDMCDLGLDKIEKENNELKIGAMVTLREMELNSTLNKMTGGSVQEALSVIVGVQFRNSATVGGSVALHAGFSDIVNIFLALDADVELYKAGRMSLDEYIKRHKDSDILMYVYVPINEGDFKYFAKRNTKNSLPVCNVSVFKSNQKVTVCIGARPGVARKYVKSPNENNADFIDNVMKSINFNSNIYASAAYRRILARTYLERGLCNEPFETTVERGLCNEPFETTVERKLCEESVDISVERRHEDD